MCMQQQQQQQPGYDLLAVFPSETQADTAASKLHKEGFTDDEVYQMDPGQRKGEFREHGPNTARRDIFLQTQRSGPNPALIIFLAVVCGLLVAALTFAATFVIPLPEPTTLLIGAAVGIVLGIIIGLLRRGRVRGAIGQATPPPTSPKAAAGARTVVALR